MSINIDKRIDDVLKQFKTELKTSKVIDNSGNVTDKKAFAKLVDQNIKRLNDLEKYIASEAGIITDKYAANILYKNIQSLKDMKEYNSLNPNLSEENIHKGEIAEEERFSTQHGWFTGIKKIFGKMKSTPQNEHDSR